MKRKSEELSPSSSNQFSNTHSFFRKQKIWSHVELGAANYGENVNADSTHISNGTLSKNQHQILFMTADELIKNKGDKGIIYINDLDEKMVSYTIDKLKEYINKEYPESDIEIKPLVGDFFKIDIPMVTSIHLKNPERWFFDSLKGDNKNRLKYFADHSKEGLILATYYTKHFYKKMNKLGIACEIVDDNFSPYIHADGSIITCGGNVVKFSIKSSDNISVRLRSNSSNRMTI